MFNFIRFYDIDITKILGQEPQFYFKEYKIPVKRQKGHKKPIKRRRMLKR